MVTHWKRMQQAELERAAFLAAGGVEIDHSKCNDCELPNDDENFVGFMTTNRMWDEVMVTEENPKGRGHLCVVCFAKRARARGLNIPMNYVPHRNWRWPEK
jgi:ribosomal protein S18 acetylase RimI-like enzyme